MNARETAIVAAAERRYQRSYQATVDLFNDKQRRAMRDLQSGHSPRCSLTKCAHDCPSLNAKGE